MIKMLNSYQIMSHKMEVARKLCVEDSKYCSRNTMFQLLSSTNGAYSVMYEKCLSKNDGLSFPLGPCCTYEGQNSVLYLFSGRHPSSNMVEYFSTLG